MTVVDLAWFFNVQVLESWINNKLKSWFRSLYLLIYGVNKIMVYLDWYLEELIVLVCGCVGGRGGHWSGGACPELRGGVCLCRFSDLSLTLCASVSTR